MTDQCAVCGRAYSRASRPRFAFAKDTARFIGTKHTACSDPRMRDYGGAPLEVDFAQRYAWFRLDQSRVWGSAGLLFLEPGIERRAGFLEWWMSDRNPRGQKTPDEIDALRTELWALEIAYADWLSETYPGGEIAA